MVADRHLEIAGIRRHVWGATPSHRDLTAPRLSVPLVARLAMPSHVSLRDVAYATPVRDQQWLGACVGFAVTDALNMTAKRQRIEATYSPLWAYDWARLLEGKPLSEDSGCAVIDMTRVVTQIGCIYEASMPYQPEQYTAVPGNVLKLEAAANLCTFYYVCDSLAAIKYSLSQGFAPAFAMRLPENVRSERAGKTGIIDYPSASEAFVGGHALLCVGYDDDRKMLQFKNSWGPWGDGGYGYIGYPFVTDFIADNFTTYRRLRGDA